MGRPVIRIPVLGADAETVRTVALGSRFKVGRAFDGSTQQLRTTFESPLSDLGPVKLQHLRPQP